jgi:4a-hydroxytetrahydrobiopterin dehydratase
MAKRLSVEEAKMATTWAVMVEGDVAKGIQKNFLFNDFVACWSFMSAVALRAEKMDHHPDWTNVYNRLQVTLNTHDAHGVTEKDLQLAAFMDELYQKRTTI